MFNLRLTKLYYNSTVYVFCYVIFFFFYFRILPLGVISYFVAGALIMKYRYNATGTDIIPNKKFWIMLPGLIKVWLAFNVSLIILLLCHLLFCRMVVSSHLVQ